MAHENCRGGGGKCDLRHDNTVFIVYGCVVWHTKAPTRTGEVQLTTVTACCVLPLNNSWQTRDKRCN